MFPQNFQVVAETGELAQLVAAFDWASTSLGPILRWPGYVQNTVRLLLQSPLPIVTLWGDEGVLIYNDAYAEFAAARHPRLLGAKVLEGWPEAAELNRRVLRAGLAGQTLSFRDEHLILHRHGYAEDLWLNLDYSPIPDDDGRPAGVFCVVVETTQQIRLERQRAADLQAINAAEARQRCLVELGDRLRGLETTAEITGAAAAILAQTLRCTRAGYATVDAQGDTNIENDWTDGTVPSLMGRHKFRDLGPSFTTPLSRGETVAVRDVADHPATADAPDAWNGLQTRAVVNVPLLENAKVTALLYVHNSAPRDWTRNEISLLKDVADRIWEAMSRARANQALRQINVDLEHLVQERTAQRDRMWTLSTDVMMMTGLDARIITVNPAWTTLLGWTEAELLGRKFMDFIHPDDLEPTRAESSKLRQGRAVVKFENRYRAKDGSYFWLSWKAVPDGEVIHSVARDVTAERQQAEALQATEETLRHVQKMEAVGQLTGGIAHDFNNFLQGIIGSLDLIQKRVAQGRTQDLAGHAANAMAAANRAVALTHRLLAFSRRQPLDPKPLLANPLILSMEDLLRRTLSEKVHLQLSLEAALWPTMCDASQLDSAILNLAINARDAMPDGGLLTISTENTQLSEAFAAKADAVKPGDYVCIRVADTGTGMPPEVIERAFDPFFTTKPLGQGTGLGLSMVYGFMRQSGGHAEIVSQPGIGTSINLYLPRCTGAIQDDACDAESRTSANGAGSTVLVLEDEQVVRDIVVVVLEELGYHSLEAASGPEGLEILRSKQKIDLLVTDIGLPGLNGRQVADAARLIRPELKILLMTGYAEAAATPDGVLARGMAMITKPFSIDRLAGQIKTIIETD
jgi:PAS domain S-box-containing protein